MTEITSRQEEVLNRVVKSHIDLAEPVSSKYLKRKFNLPFSSATIRAEMQRLTETGHLYQPHTSAGRVPTDKGYRFFVNSLKQVEGIVDDKISLELKKLRKRAENHLALLKESSRLLSLFSSDLVISYTSDSGIFIKEGWKKILDDPEFSDISRVKDFVSMIEYFEDNINCFDLSQESMQIYIGKEVPISKTDNFSIIISRCPFSNNQDGILAILGLKRMAYERNISLLNSIVEILNQD